MGRVSSTGAISSVTLSDVMTELNILRWGAGRFNYVMSRKFAQRQLFSSDIIARPYID